MAKFHLALLAALLIGLLSTVTAGAQIPPDDIKSYVVTVEPQPDGALKMKYDFNYCAVTDFPDDTQHLWVGVPNSSFELLDYGPKDWVVSANSRGSASQVELNFAHLPKAGECFNLTFTILQRRMAYPTGGNVSFEFTPGWFDFARIDELKINWRLPDVKLIKLLDPVPTKQGGGVATWVQTNLAPNQKFTVKVLVDKTAFGALAAEPSPAAAPTGGGGDVLGTIVIVFVVILVVVVVLALLAAWVKSDGDGGYTYPTSRRSPSGDSYTGGGYIGGYHSSPPSSHSSSSSNSSSSRSGGGSGSFGSRGSSCACVSSCACACACASGGRVGCSEKGYDISCLLDKKKKE